MKLAGWFRRFLASMSDSIIVGLFAIPFAVVIVPIFFITDSSFINTVGAALFMCIEAVYFVYYETSNYQASLGKQLFGLYVATERDKKISIGQAIARYVLWRVSMVLSVGLLVVLPFLIKKRCLHDMMTNTNVFSRN